MGDTSIVTLLSTKVDNERFRMVKVDAGAAIDIRICDQVAPYGIESCPVDGIAALLDETSMDGHNIIGYFNYDVLTGPGEIRVYSTDVDANLKAYVWCKNDGVLLLNGDVDHAVRYSKLEEAFNQLKADFNDLVQKYNSHVHTTTATVGTGPAGVISAPSVSGTISNADITGAKIETIKTP